MAPSKDKAAIPCVPATAAAPPNPVDGARLLDDLTAVFKRFLVLPDGAADMMALWAVHTHAFDACTHSPRLLLTSPEPGCGKTVAVTLLKHLSARAEYFSSAREAAVLRYMDKHKAQPRTLLFDEADTFFADKPTLKSTLNASYERGRALINVPTDAGGWDPSVFSLRAPVAIAGIGGGWLWPALSDRSVEVKMRKRRRDEQIEAFGPEHERKLKALAKRAAQWASANITALRTAKPEMPNGVINRDADKWRPLVAVADRAGGRWPKLARQLCQRFVGQRPDVSNGVALIAACAAIFRERGSEELFTDDLLKALNDLPDQPWADDDGEFALDDIALPRLLRPYGIKPTRLSINGVQRRGYRRVQFKEACEVWAPVQAAVDEAA